MVRVVQPDGPRGVARETVLVPWQIVDDLDAFAEAALPLLAARPAENTVALTVVAQLRDGLSWSSDPPVFGVCVEQASGTPRAVGAVLMTPPHNLLLPDVPAGTVAGLVEALAGADVDVPGVTGPAETADAFVRAWTAATGRGVAGTVERRLYVLGTLAGPEPAPEGRPRLATAADLDVVGAWWREFHAETDHRRLSGELEHQRVTAHVEADRVWLWEDGSGRVVSMASRSAVEAGVARVGPVYTPGARRGHGYGTAVTAACTAGALAAGAGDVVLFTDLANPTSNAIYQRIGYRAVEDHREVRFAG
jgi:RimJ/RimL family protein N-acetyltransferase